MKTKEEFVKNPIKGKVAKVPSVENESYEVGDFVKIKERDNPNHIVGFTKKMIKEYGGCWCRIREIKISGYFILNTIEGAPIKYLWSEEMFSEHRKVLIESPYKKDILVDVSESSISDSTVEKLKREYPDSIKKEYLHMKQFNIDPWYVRLYKGIFLVLFIYVPLVVCVLSAIFTLALIISLPFLGIVLLLQLL